MIDDLMEIMMMMVMEMEIVMGMVFEVEMVIIPPLQRSW